MTIGFFIGQLLIGIIMAVSNAPVRTNMTEAATITRQANYILGIILIFTAAGALIGAGVETFF